MENQSTVLGRRNVIYGTFSRGRGLPEAGGKQASKPCGSTGEVQLDGHFYHDFRGFKPSPGIPQRFQVRTWSSRSLTHLDPS